MHPLAPSLARILRLLGAASALGALGLRIPGEWDDQQVRTSTTIIMLTKSELSV